MNMKFQILVFLASSALLTLPLVAASPIYSANAAAVTDVDPITENWNCNSPSIVPSSRCYFGNVQGNGAPYGDIQPVAGVIVQIGFPAPQWDNPTTASFIYWMGGADNFGFDGPGSTYTGGDNFVVWRTPNTHNGRRAQGGTVTLMNDQVRPDGIHLGGNFVAASGSNAAFWLGGGFQWDSDIGKWRIAAAATYPTGNPSTFTDITHYIGDSSSGYQNYTWRDIVNFRFNPSNPTPTTHYGIYWSYQGRSMAKDPNNQYRWIGSISWSNFTSGSFAGRGSAPAMLDFSQAGTPGIGVQLCLGFQKGLDMSDPRARLGFNNQYDFYCYREAEKAPVTTRPKLTNGALALPASMFGDLTRTVAVVNTSYGTHGEIWLSSASATPLWCADSANRALLGYSSESQCALDRAWCQSFLDNTLYLNNRLNLAGGTTDRIRYSEWNLSTLWKVGTLKDLDNELTGLFGSTRGWPSPRGDHGSYAVFLTRYDWNEFLGDGSHKEALYVARKRSICLEPWNWGNARYGGIGSSYLNLIEK